MRRTDFDAVAIGGGLAGSAFAIVLARAGLRVAVIERAAQAKLKVCGDFLSAEAQDLLSALGVDLWTLGAYPLSVFRIANGTRAAESPLPFRAAGFSRFALDEILLAKAGEAGAEIIRGEAVTAIEPSSSGIAIRAGTATCTAASAGLATGKLNLRGCPRPGGPLTAFKMSFELGEAARTILDGRVQLFAFAGGYIGACHIEGGASTLCWLADPAFMRRTNGRWQAQLDELAKASPHIGDLLGGARPVFEKPATTSAIPYGFRRRTMIDARFYPLGDQLAVIPSFTGDGTSIALSSGIEAARAVLNGVDAGEFQKAFLRRLGSQFRWAGVIDLAFRSETSRRLGVTAIGLFPSLATRLTALTRLPGVPDT